MAERINGLDGVRGIAIGCVLFAHVMGTGSIPLNVHVGHFIADLGVRTFFVLSGFLITTLLLREQQSRHRISLRGFYLRRALRIFPAFYAFLGATLLFAGWLAIRAAIADLPYAATYTMNFHLRPEWTYGHLWSLAVEEQFYLCWPLIVALAGPRRAVPAAICAIALAPIVRLVCWYRWPELRPLSDEAFPCVFDALAMGCLVACLLDRLEQHPRYRALLVRPSGWIAVAACIAPLLVGTPWFALGASMTAGNAGIALAIHRVAFAPASRPTRLLDTRAFVWVGTLSYSIYLWQQLFVNRHAAGWMHRFPQNVGFAVIAAMISYRFVERPFLALSHKLRTPAPASGERRQPLDESRASTPGS